MDKEIENRTSIIDDLHRQIKDRDRDIHLAAKFGKQLLDEKEVLLKKLDGAFSSNELLEQEKYSLQNALEMRLKTVDAQNSELELQKKEMEDVTEKNKLLEKERSAQKQRIQNLIKEKCELERYHQESLLEISSLKRALECLQQQMGDLQHIHEVTLIEDGREDILQEELTAAIAKHKELKDKLAELQFELDSTKLRESRLEKQVQELLEEVHDRDKEIASFTVEIQKSKESQADLQCEVEALKMMQVDVRRRGNSVFGELDDRRVLVEDEFRALRTRYLNLKKNYEEKQSELSRCKNQMSILLSMPSYGRRDEDYISGLERSLAERKDEVCDLTAKLKSALRVQQKSSGPQPPSSKGAEYNYLRVMLQQAEKEIESLKKEVMALHVKKIENDDKLVNSQHLLYQGRQELDVVKAENVKLKMKISELTFKPEEMVNIKREPRREAIPGFKLSTAEKSENNSTECEPKPKSSTKSPRNSHNEENSENNAVLRHISLNTEPGLESVYKSTTYKRNDGNCAQQ